MCGYAISILRAPIPGAIELFPNVGMDMKALDLFPGDRLALLSAMTTPTVLGLFKSHQNAEDFLEGLAKEAVEAPNKGGWNEQDTLA